MAQYLNISGAVIKLRTWSLTSLSPLSNNLDTLSISIYLQSEFSILLGELISFISVTSPINPQYPILALVSVFSDQVLVLMSYIHLYGQ